MTAAIRIYVEGGGEGAETREIVRQGFRAFFTSIVERARAQGIRCDIVVCGSRDRAYRDFRLALKTHPNAFNILLVDAEAPVKVNSPWQHLGWNDVGTGDEHCHLMVQMMEAWLIADVNTLSDFYGKGFRRNVIPHTKNVEELDKARIEVALRDATRDTSKGRYHKIQHGPKLLARVKVPLVRDVAKHCDRLFETLNRMVGE